MDSGSRQAPSGHDTGSDAKNPVTNWRDEDWWDKGFVQSPVASGTSWWVGQSCDVDSHLFPAPSRPDTGTDVKNQRPTGEWLEQGFVQNRRPSNPRTPNGVKEQQCDESQQRDQHPKRRQVLRSQATLTTLEAVEHYATRPCRPETAAGVQNQRMSVPVETSTRALALRGQRQEGTIKLRSTCCGASVLQKWNTESCAGAGDGQLCRFLCRGKRPNKSSSSFVPPVDWEVACLADAETDVESQTQTGVKRHRWIMASRRAKWTRNPQSPTGVQHQLGVGFELLPCTLEA